MSSMLLRPRKTPAPASLSPNSNSASAVQEPVCKCRPKRRKAKKASATSSSSALQLPQYNTDDEDLTSGSSDDSDDDRVLTTVKGTSKTTLTAHTPVTAIKRIALNIREFRQVQGRATKEMEDNPMVVALGDSLFLVQPNFSRKDCSITPLKVAPNGDLLRDGTAKTYRRLGTALDRKAEEFELDNAQMNENVAAIRNNWNAELADVPNEVDEECMQHMRELALILLLDHGRSSRADELIETQAMDDDKTFTQRLGTQNPSYIGAPRGGSKALQAYTDAQKQNDESMND